MTTSSVTSRSYFRPSRSYRPSPRPPPTYSISIHPLLADAVQHTWWWTCACWEVCGTLVTVQLVSKESLEQLSLLVLASHNFLYNFQALADQYSSDGSDGNNGDLNMTAVAVAEIQEEQAPLIPFAWIWAVPLLMLFTIGVITSSPYWWRPHRGETMVMVTALVSLFLLEALLPVMIFISTAMLFLRQVHVWCGLAMIGGVWAVLTCLTHMMRCAVYQNLGGH